MSLIVLTEEQAQLVAQARAAIPVHDHQGKVVGYLEPTELTPQELAELKRRAKSPGPRYTGGQVQARLRALQEEWDRKGGFDPAYMQEFLDRLNAEACDGCVRRT